MQCTARTTRAKHGSPLPESFADVGASRSRSARRRLGCQQDRRPVERDPPATTAQILRDPASPRNPTHARHTPVPAQPLPNRRVATFRPERCHQRRAVVAIQLCWAFAGRRPPQHEGIDARGYHPPGWADQTAGRAPKGLPFQAGPESGAQWSPIATRRLPRLPRSLRLWRTRRPSAQACGSWCT